VSAVEAAAALLLPLAMFVIVWPLVELANRRRPACPARKGQTSYRIGTAQVSWDATRIDPWSLG
jgi:hypothetical protein